MSVDSYDIVTLPICVKDFLLSFNLRKELQTQTEEAGHRGDGLLFLYSEIMKDFATAFYKSKAWKSCRDSYMESRSGLCEECLARGVYSPAEIVHHIIELTPENITDPNVTLSWSNLRAVCRECHAAAHGARQRRYKVDPSGRVTIRF